MEKSYKILIKRQIACILIVISIVSCYPGFKTVTVSADNEVIKCSMGSGEGYPGDEIEIIVNIESNPGTIMSETSFSYDSDIVEVIDIESKDLFKCDSTDGQESEWINPNYEKNPIKMIDGYLTVRDNSDNTGEMYVIHLKIKDVDFNGMGSIESRIKFEGSFYDWELNEYVIKPAQAALVVHRKENSNPVEADEDNEVNKSDTENRNNESSSSDDNAVIEKSKDNHQADVGVNGTDSDKDAENADDEISDLKKDSQNDDINKKSEKDNTNRDTITESDNHRTGKIITIVGIAVVILLVIIVIIRVVILHKKTNRTKKD